MGKLKDSKCYLSGAIEHDKCGTNWRPAVIQELSQRFGVNVFDPFGDPKQKMGPRLKDAKERGDLKAMQEIASKFVRKDLGEVDRSDFIISRIAYEHVCYQDDTYQFMLANERYIAYDPLGSIPSLPWRLRQVPTTGTIHEIINSDLYHKPTLVICEEGAHNIPAWLIGFLPLQYLFGSWKQLYDYLEEVNSGACADDKRWELVYGSI
jgi:hypothetical protein